MFYLLISMNLDVRLIYCESGIETFCDREDILLTNDVRLIYCESGIETVATDFAITIMGQFV